MTNSTTLDREFIAKSLVTVLEENVGQRLTIALANGILAQLSQLLDVPPVEVPTEK